MTETCWLKSASQTTNINSEIGRRRGLGDTPHATKLSSERNWKVTQRSGRRAKYLPPGAVPREERWRDSCGDSGGYRGYKHDFKFKNSRRGRKASHSQIHQICRGERGPRYAGNSCHHDPLPLFLRRLYRWAAQPPLIQRREHSPLPRDCLAFIGCRSARVGQQVLAE